jgi:hypothetical protein
VSDATAPQATPAALPAPPPSWSPPPAALKPVARQRDVRVVSVVTGGFVVIEDNAPVGVALDPAGAGAALARVLAA